MGLESSYPFPLPVDLTSLEMARLSPKIKHESMENTAQKVDSVQTVSPKHERIAGGAVKEVFKRSDIKESRVYYTPVYSFTGGAEKELQEEFKTMSTINDSLRNVENGNAHLAIQGKVMEGDGRINKKYTLQVEEASGDWEKKMIDEETTFDERIRFGGHFLNGMTNLHRVDYTHGDPKPENCLIYEPKGEKSCLKVSDFGKARVIKDNDSEMYLGNLRYAPPEGRQSKKGDVYGAALMLIRNFEEPFLTGDGAPLIKIDEKDRDMEASENLRGIERFVIENKEFLACNKGLNFAIFMRRVKLAMPSQISQEKQVGEVHRYIDALRERYIDDLNKRLENDEPIRLQFYQIEALCELLKHMTDVDPTTRISSERAEKIYNEIFMGIDRP